MYQISTLQALLQGYTKAVVSVRELCENGEIGLGTFEDVNGEMIMLGGKVYENPMPQDKQTVGCDAFNAMVAADPEVEVVLLPIRDGISIIRKK